MKIAIFYQSLTGNTQLLAEHIKSLLPTDDVIYCGVPGKEENADLYFIGSWTDKGMCSDEIANLLRSLQGKKIAYFGTAGFGGSQAYYDSLFDRIRTIIPPSNQIIGSFYCQGKMPETVKQRYLTALSQHPDDAKLKASLENYEKALTHPDQDDLHKLEQWVNSVLANF